MCGCEQFVEDRKRKGGRFDSLGQIVAVKCVEHMTGSEKADGLISFDQLVVVNSMWKTGSGKVEGLIVVDNLWP